MATEIERAGIALVQITAVTPVAKAVGVNRVVKGRAIISVTGDPELPPAEEKEMRRQLVMDALKALTVDDKVG